MNIRIILITGFSFLWQLLLTAQPEVFEDKGKYGIRDMEEVLLPANYSYITYDSNNLIYIVFKASKQNELSPGAYNKLKSKHQLTAPPKHKLGLFDQASLTLLEPDYQQISFYDSGSILAKDKRGMYLISREFLDRANKKPFTEIIPVPHLNTEEEPIESYFFIKNKKSWGIMSLSTELGTLFDYIPLEFDSLAMISNKNLYQYKALKEGKWGIIEGEGQVIVPFEFEGIDYYADEESTFQGCIIAQKNGKTGLFHDDYDYEKVFEIIPPQYDSMQFISYSRLRLWKNGKMGIYEIKESAEENMRYKVDELLPVVYEKVENVSYQEDKALNEIVFLSSFNWKDTDYQVVYKERMVGLLNEGAATIHLPAAYSSLTFGPGNLLQLHKGNKLGVALLTNGNDAPVIIYAAELDSFQLDSANTKTPYLWVYQKGKAGLMNLDDFSQLPVEYTILDHLECQAYEDEIWGVENHSYLLAKKDDKCGLVNMDFTEVLPFEYDRIEQHEFLVDNEFDLLMGGNYTLLYKNGKMGLWSFCADLSLKAEYDEIKALSWKEKITTDYFLVREKGKWGLYDYVSQKMVLPIKYDQISLQTIQEIEVKQGTKKEVLALKKLRDKK